VKDADRCHHLRVAVSQVRHRVEAAWEIWVEVQLVNEIDMPLQKRDLIRGPVVHPIGRRIYGRSGGEPNETISSSKTILKRDTPIGNIIGSYLKSVFDLRPNGSHAP
jgi:hypothetical protein